MACFNGHCGIDGWGRPYEFWAACRAIGADLLVLPELFVPDDAPESDGLGAGWRLVTAELARARLVRSDPRRAGTRRWGPARPLRAAHALRLEGPPTSRRRRLGPSEGGRSAVRGSLRLGIATRLPLRSHRVLELPRLPREEVSRKAIALTVVVGEHELVVVGTHLGHLSHGAWRQARFLSRELSGAGRGVLAGDMNCWGPPLLAQFPGWRRAVRGRSWPAWRPHSQIDHLLVRGGITVRAAAVLGDLGSDHRPVRAKLSLDPIAATRSSPASKTGDRG